METYRTQKTCKCGNTLAVDYEVDTKYERIDSVVSENGHYNQNLTARRGQFPSGVRCRLCGRWHSLSSLKRVS